MHVTYRPGDGDTLRWEFDPGRVRASAAELIEKRAGRTYEQWLAEVQTGAVRARRVLLWHLMSQQHPTLRYEDTPDFYADELLIEHTAAELAEVRQRVERAGLSDADREMALAVLDQQIAEAAARDGEDAGPGKAASSSGA